jgi:hypothetical protein
MIGQWVEPTGRDVVEMICRTYAREFVTHAAQ